MAKATSKVVRIACQGAATMPLKDILPFQGALKSLADEDYERLKKLILRLGFSFPFHIWREKAGKVTHHHILDGHQRLETLSRMAADPEIIVPLEFPVDWVEAGTLKEAKEKVLASVSQFGKVGAVGLADFAKEAGISFVDLANNFRFPEIDMSGFGKAAGASGGNPGNCDPDEVPDPPKVAVTKLGQLWILGEHRLLCGDSTKAITQLLAGEKVDMIYTDPPYGMRLDTDYSTMIQKDGRTGNKFRKVEGDDKDFDPRFYFENFKDVREQFWFGADYYCQHLPKGGSWIVWDKRESSVTGSQVSPEMFGAMFELCWSKSKHKRDIARIMWAGGLGEGKSEDRKGRNNSIDRCHPTQKPIMLAEWFFERWGEPGDIVADLFLGSGSTLIACEKTGRRCFGMEIDPIYCDVIVERWEKFSGKKAVLGV